MKKTRPIAALLVTILLLSLGLSIVQIGNANNQANPVVQTQENRGLSITAHHMTAGELQEYKQAVGTYQDGQIYNKMVAGHGTGLSPPDNSTWETIAQNAYTVEDVTYQTQLPTSVDLTTSQYFPPIGDQANQGSCASFAIGYYCKTYQEAKEHNWNLTGATWTGGADDGNISLPYQDKIMSPAFVYNLINGGNDVGSDFETPIRLICNVGVSSWAKMPYYWQDCTRWPTEEAWAEAPMYRSNSTFSYQYLHVNTTQGMESLKNWIAAGNLAVIGLDASNNLVNFTATSNQDLLTTDNYVLGCLDHAATIVGYDDSFAYTENGTTHYGAIKIANTWGKGGWETIPDGCYWISYNTVLELATTEANPAVLFENLVDYQPEILASFNITHLTRSHCNITFGLGTPEAPTATKSFTQYINGGNHSFCPNNIVFDLTDLKKNVTNLYNQTFFMTIYDGGNLTGTVNYFAVQNVNNTQTPVQTIANDTIALTVGVAFADPTLNLSPSTGPANGTITLTGVGFSGTTIDVAYLNPQTQTWTTLAENMTATSNFTYTTKAPDLQQANPAGDNAPQSSQISYRVHDDGSDHTFNASSPYSEYHRGLTQVSTQTASGIFGNNTDLSSAVYLQKGDSFTVEGKWFAPGTITILWDTIVLGTASVNQEGTFTAALTVPTSQSGEHTLKADDGSAVFAVTVTKESTPAASATPTPTHTATAHPTATATPTPAPTVPEYSTSTLLILTALLTASLLIVTKIKKTKTVT